MKVRMVTEPVNVAALVGFVIALTPVRDLFYGSGLPPLSFLMVALRQMGDACSPLMTMLLGASFAKGGSSNIVDVPTTSALAVTRLCLLPLCGLLFHRRFAGSGLLPQDRMMQFILLMETCMPSAMALAMVCESPGTVRACSALLFPQYIFGIVPMTICIGIFLVEIQHVEVAGARHQELALSAPVCATVVLLTMAVGAARVARCAKPEKTERHAQ